MTATTHVLRTLLAVTFLVIASFGAAQPVQTVTVWGQSRSADDRALDAQVREFERRYPQYKVRLLGMGAGGMNPQKLMAAIVGNAPPDVIRQDRFNINDWASRGAFMPLDDLIERDRNLPDGLKREDFYQAPWSEGVYEGKTYGIPVGADVRILYYNKAIFREKAAELRAAGLDPNRAPRTWTEYLQYSKIFTKFDEKGNLVRVGSMPNFGSTSLYFYVLQNNGGFLSEDGKHATFYRPENVEALEYMFKGYEVVGGRQKTQAFERSFQWGTDNPFLRGQVAMHIMGEWDLPNYYRLKPNFELGSAPAPVPDDRFYKRGRFKDEPKTFNTWFGGFAYCIPTGAKNVEGAWAFIRFTQSLEGHQIAARAQSELEKSKGNRFFPKIYGNRLATEWAAKEYANQDTDFDRAFYVHVEAMDYAVKRHTTFAAQAIWDGQVRAFDRSIDGFATIEEALKEADVNVQRIYDEFYAMQSMPQAETKTPAIVAAVVCVLLVIVFAVWVLRQLKNPISKQEAKAGYLFISPWVLGFLIFTAGPMLVSLYLSFTLYNVLSPPRWIGMRNYQDIVGRDWPIIWKGIQNASYLAGIGIPLGNIAGLMIALLLNQNVKGMRFYRTMFYLPAILPGVATIILWKFLLDPNPDTGFLNMLWRSTIQQWFDVVPPSWFSSAEWSRPSLIFMGLWGAGSGMMLWLAGLKGIPTTLYEAADIDGASTRQKFWKITIPQLTPLIFFNLIMAVIGALQTFTEVYIVTGGSAAGPGDSLTTPVLFLFMQAFSYFRMGFASALAWALFVVVLILTAINLWLGKFWVHTEVSS